MHDGALKGACALGSGGRSLDRYCGRSFAVSVPAATSAEVDQTAHGMIFEHDVPVSVRDGTVLRADVYRPDAEGEFPVLMSLSAYQKVLDRVLPLVPAK